MLQGEMFNSEYSKYESSFVDLDYKIFGATGKRKSLTFLLSKNITIKQFKLFFCLAYVLFFNAAKF